MKFRAHDTFYIRKGWLYKGLKNIEKKGNIFTDKQSNAGDVLGMGVNMVKALRYWLQAVDLTEETKSVYKSQSLTKFGQLVWENDKYIEELGTLWLLHYKLAINQKLATAWEYFFNDFNFNEFTKEDFVSSIGNYIKMKGETLPAISSLESDFDCIISTYVSRYKMNPGKVIPENNIDCPFGELGLIDIVNKRGKIFKKSYSKLDSINPIIIFAIIVDNAGTDKEVRISSLLNDKYNIGKILNLDAISLQESLKKVQNNGYIKIIRTAGLDIIKIEKPMNFLDCVMQYYEELDQ
jgi:hypothetical protein